MALEKTASTAVWVEMMVVLSAMVTLASRAAYRASVSVLRALSAPRTLEM
jgi:hypothetical protein